MVILDGGFGTMIQAAGLPPGKDPTDWNVENPEAVTAVHRAYVEAGAEIILANTFGANRLKYHGEHELGELIRAAIRNARVAAQDSTCSRVARGTMEFDNHCTPSDSRGYDGRRALVALDIGPTGKLLKPAGDLDFDEAYEAFAEMVKESLQPSTFNLQPDLIFIETMGDTREIKAAVLAAKENCDLPVYVTVALGEDGKLLTGADVETVATMLEALGVDAYGFNCGLGPDRMLPFVERLAKVSTKPMIVKPNAGMPRLVKETRADGSTVEKTVFEVGPEEFARHVAKLVEAGATIVGGCCGTTPRHIGAVRVELGSGSLASRSAYNGGVGFGCSISSGVMSLALHSGEGLIIGERINPTGKKKLKEAYARGDQAYILREAVMQVEAGAKILDVNCGVPGIDEAATLEKTLAAVESVVTCPLQIDTADPAALERALRRVNGKALVNSVNGKRESMDAVFPLVKKYGGAIVALCLDEGGIPATSEGRIAIAEKILAEGAKYGFGKKDFVFDALTLAVSADADAARVTLETVRRLTDELGVNTVLGVSNVSFGLPDRPTLNNTMYALAKRAGLSAAIANPAAIRDEVDPAAEDVLLGRDPGCARWIAAHAVATSGDAQNGGMPRLASSVGGSGDGDNHCTPSDSRGLTGGVASLVDAIRHGLKEDAGRLAETFLSSLMTPMQVIEKGIVPALEEVGKGFEEGKVFLPQLLMAADAAGAAFAAVRRALARGVARGTMEGDDHCTPSDSRGSDALARGVARGTMAGTIILATVKGDIHDIGKNIVRALLENYGFDVIDLGRDVPPEEIVAAAVGNGVKLVGLSALMTTTVGAMAETIRQLKAADPTISTFVGGAVVTQEYADSIGATYYTKDAMASVRLAKSFFRREG